MAPNASLAQYKTFAFRQAPHRAQPESIADQAIQSALRQDLAAKGIIEATNGQPDFYIAYHVKKQQELEAEPLGYGWWGGPADVTTYTQGTLIVDFIDPHSNQAFWRGTATQVLNHPETANPAKIEKVVGQLVNKYPAQMAVAPRTTM